MEGKTQQVGRRKLNMNQLNEEWKQKSAHNIFLPLVTVILNSIIPQNHILGTTNVWPIIQMWVLWSDNWPFKRIPIQSLLERLRETTVRCMQVWQREGNFSRWGGFSPGSFANLGYHLTCAWIRHRWQRACLLSITRPLVWNWKPYYPCFLKENYSAPQDPIPLLLPIDWVSDEVNTTYKIVPGWISASTIWYQTFRAPAHPFS